MSLMPFKKKYYSNNYNCLFLLSISNEFPCSRQILAKRRVRCKSNIHSIMQVHDTIYIDFSGWHRLYLPLIDLT